MRDFRKLKAWERGHRLTLPAHRVTGTFPNEEKYGLTSQIRRSCASIPANIAEGYGRGSNARMARFLQVALGSASELEYHLLLARDLHLLEASDRERPTREVIEIKHMLTAFVQNLKAFANHQNLKADA